MGIFKKKIKTEEIFDPEMYFDRLYEENVLEEDGKNKWVDENINKFQFLEKYNISVCRNDKEIVIQGDNIYPYKYSYYISKPLKPTNEFHLKLLRDDVRWNELKVDKYDDWSLKDLLSSIFLSFDIEKKENV